MAVLLIRPTLCSSFGESALLLFYSVGAMASCRPTKYTTDNVKLM